MASRITLAASVFIHHYPEQLLHPDAREQAATAITVSDSEPTLNYEQKQLCKLQFSA
jgi:hypothetical protein